MHHSLPFAGICQRWQHATVLVRRRGSAEHAAAPAAASAVQRAVQCHSEARAALHVALAMHGQTAAGLEQTVLGLQLVRMQACSTLVVNLCQPLLLTLSGRAWWALSSVASCAM
jgi:hypothetical protein